MFKLVYNVFVAIRQQVFVLTTELSRADIVTNLGV